MSCHIHRFLFTLQYNQSLIKTILHDEHDRNRESLWSEKKRFPDHHQWEKYRFVYPEKQARQRSCSNQLRRSSAGHHGARPQRQLCQCDRRSRQHRARGEQSGAISEHTHRQIRQPHLQRQVPTARQGILTCSQQRCQLTAWRQQRIQYESVGRPADERPVCGDELREFLR